MPTRHPSRALPALVLLLAAAACVRQPAPGAGIPPITPTPGAERQWRFAYAPGSYTYLVEQSAVIDLAGDTAGARDSVRTSAVVHYRLTSAPQGVAVAGTVDSFQVVAGRTGGVQRPLSAPVTFEAVIDTALHRVALRGAMANAGTAPDCTSPAPGLALTARDLLVALPARLETGQTWRDSLTTITCRGDIPITNRIEHRYEVEGRDTYSGIVAVRLRRSARTMLEGSASPRGVAVSLTGEGNGDTRLWVDAATGRLLGATGEATTRLTLEAAGTSRTLTQRAVQRVTLRGL
jgi:hypothetical protein